MKLRYLNWKTLNTAAPTKHLGYSAFALQSAALQVKGAIETCVGVLGEDSLSELWSTYNDLIAASAALEGDFDAFCIIEEGKRFGPAAGFTRFDSCVETLDEYLQHKNRFEED